MEHGASSLLSTSSDSNQCKLLPASRKTEWNEEDNITMTESLSDLQLCLGLQGLSLPAAHFPNHDSTSYHYTYANSSGSSLNLPADHAFPNDKGQPNQVSHFSQESPEFQEKGQGNILRSMPSSSPTALQGTLYHSEYAKGHGLRSLSLPQGYDTVGDYSRLPTLFQDHGWRREDPLIEDTHLNESLHFSPLYSTTSILQTSRPCLSTSSVSSSLDELTFLMQNPMAARKNYFLAFQDLQNSSVSHFSKSKNDRNALYATKLDDSGTASDPDLALARTASPVTANQVSEKEYVPREREGDRSSSSTNSGKLKCWTDVMESYEAEPHLEPRTGSPLAENPYEQELRQRDESIIGSLQKTDRKYRSSSTLKTHPDSQSRPDSYTSGYSSSSSVTASGSVLTRKTQPIVSVRKSPSLPLHLANGNASRPSEPLAEQPVAAPSRHPSNRYSTPDLKFLSSNPLCSSKKTNVLEPKMPRPFSCPERFIPDGTAKPQPPFTINPVEDWESLKILLPKQLQRVLALEKRRSGIGAADDEGIPSVPWGIHSEEDVPPARSPHPDCPTVCPTCFKLYRSAAGLMARSSCDCSPSSSIGSDSDSCAAHFNAVQTQKVSAAPQEKERRTVFDNLINFSGRDDHDRLPTQLIINLKHKQEMVTAVKAAAIGWLGFADFHGSRKANSANLARVISQQFTCSLLQLLEDGLHPGHTVWSSLITHCSPEVYRRHLIPTIQNGSLTTTDQERFHDFITELLRLGQLSQWLEATICRDTRKLGNYYSMDAFVFLASSVTKELCDDLLDTLNCLKTISCQHEDNRVKPAIKPNQTKPERQITSTRRLASKLGRKVSLLPSHTKLLEQPAVAAMNSQTGHPSSKPSTRENQPKKCDVKDEESPFGGATKVNSIPLEQPHLGMHMKTRWSEWHLSRLAVETGKDPWYGNEPVLPINRTDPQKAPLPTPRKSPSLFDIRTFIS